MKKIHNDKKPYKCIHCEAGFTQPTDVTRHCDRVHSSERPIQCSECECKFVRNYELNQHIKFSHPNLVQKGKENQSEELNKLYADDLKCVPCGAKVRIY